MDALGGASERTAEAGTVAGGIATDRVRNRVPGALMLLTAFVTAAGTVLLFISFLNGIPVYAVSVAVVEGDVAAPGEWSPLAGCVHNPATGETWTAARGLGAQVDRNRLPVQLPPPPLDRALVCTGFGYTSGRRRAQARVVADLLPRVRDIRRMGVASLDLCSIAAGRADAYYERGLNPWDFAAAWLVATESGVGVRGPRGGAPSGELLVAARPPLVDVLGAELDRLGADRDD